jgi:hypothetical protein
MYQKAHRDYLRDNNGSDEGWEEELEQLKATHAAELLAARKKRAAEQKDYPKKVARVNQLEHENSDLAVKNEQFEAKVTLQRRRIERQKEILSGQKRKLEQFELQKDMLSQLCRKLGAPATLVYRIYNAEAEGCPCDGFPEDWDITKDPFPELGDDKEIAGYKPSKEEIAEAAGEEAAGAEGAGEEAAGEEAAGEEGAGEEAAGEEDGEEDEEDGEEGDEEDEDGEEEQEQGDFDEYADE